MEETWEIKEAKGQVFLEPIWNWLGMLYIFIFNLSKDWNDRKKVLFWSCSFILKMSSDLQVVLTLLCFFSFNQTIYFWLVVVGQCYLFFILFYVIARSKGKAEKREDSRFMSWLGGEIWFRWVSVAALRGGAVLHISTQCLFYSQSQEKDWGGHTWVCCSNSVLPLLCLQTLTSIILYLVLGLLRVQDWLE